MKSGQGRRICRKKDTNGNYIFGSVTSGPRTLAAVKPGWNFAPANFSNPVSVGSSVSNLNFSATPINYYINGSVQYNGRPVSGVTVTLNGTNSIVTDTSGV